MRKQRKLVEMFARKTSIQTTHLCIANVVRSPAVDVTVRPVARSPIFQYLWDQFSRAKKGPVTLTVSHENDERDYIDMEDLLRAIFMALMTEQKSSYEVINICSGLGASIKQLAQLYSEVFNKPYVLKNTAEQMTRSIGTRERALRVLAWEPVIPLEEAVRRALVAS